MEIQDHKAAAPVTGTGGRFESRGQNRPPSQAAAPKDSVTAYIDRTIDMNALTGDIQKIVTAHIENSIPDDKKIMLELVNQVGELTGEVKQLRQQLDTKPYAVFSCPSGQMKDITEELAEIKALLQSDPKPMELSAEELDPIMLGPRHPHPTEVPQQPDPAPPPPPAQETPAAAPAPQPQQQPQSDSKPEEVFAQQMAPAPREVFNPKEKKKKNVISVLGNLLFYVVIIGVVVGAFLAKSGSGGSPTVIAGYSAFTVLSSSMEDTYPKGSLIVTRSVDANELEIGDDITYMASATSSITHRIIGITENYLDTGARAFETQGTMNKNPDKDPVAAANVVGKVIFCSTVLGKAASFVSANWPLLIFFVVVLAVLFAFLKWNFKREDESEQKKKAHAKR